MFPAIGVSLALQRVLSLERVPCAEDPTSYDGSTLRYRASKYDCEACDLKPRCCPKEPARYVPRSIYEGARDMARQIARSWEDASLGGCGRRSRCYLRTLNAFSSSTGFDYEDRMVHTTSSSSQQPPRTSEKWPS